MNYKKLYNEALERARQIHNGNPSSGTAIVVCEQIFPEFKESEDDKIRKEIVDFLMYGIWKENEINKVKQSQRYAKWIDYLEKQKEHKSAEWSEEDERIREELWEYFHDLQLSSDSDFSPSFTIDDILTFLKKQKEQKPIECLKAERDGWYICIKDYYRGGKKRSSVGDLVQAKGGMYIMDEKDISTWFRRAYYEEVRDAFEPNTDTNIPEKPAEWSKEDEVYLQDALWCIEKAEKVAKDEGDMGACWSARRWLNSLRGKFIKEGEK